MATYEKIRPNATTYIKVNVLSIGCFHDIAVVLTDRLDDHSYILLAPGHCPLSFHHITDRHWRKAPNKNTRVLPVSLRETDKLCNSQF